MEICRVVLPWTLVISVNTLPALQSGNSGVGPLAGPLDPLGLGQTVQVPRPRPTALAGYGEM